MHDHVGSSSDALGRLQYKNYDLLLVDLMMTDMDGLELFRAIRRMKPGQRVLLTSILEADARIESAIAEGVNGWIRKPFTFEALERRVWETLKADERFRSNGR